MRKRAFVISNFRCIECGNNIPLPRKASAQREKDHIKDIYCPYCNKMTKFKEIRFMDFEFDS